MKTISLLFITILAVTFSFSGYASDITVEPKSVHVAQGLDEKKAKMLLDTAARYYSFWDTGKEEYARQSLSENFVDLNLPEGRAQGLEGVFAASKQFRAAIPDLSVSIEQVYVLDKKVIGQLLITGHFTGTFGDVKGEGQPVSFTAVDIYTIEEGKIISNWHLEDNLTVMKQLGMIK